ncbi:unnamed protein product [Gadus morhua 'NCC']
MLRSDQPSASPQNMNRPMVERPERSTRAKGQRGNEGESSDMPTAGEKMDNTATDPESDTDWSTNSSTDSTDSSSSDTSSSSSDGRKKKRKHKKKNKKKSKKASKMSKNKGLRVTTISDVVKSYENLTSPTSSTPCKRRRNLPLPPASSIHSETLLDRADDFLDAQDVEDTNPATTFQSMDASISSQVTDIEVITEEEFNDIRNSTIGWADNTWEDDSGEDDSWHPEMEMDDDDPSSIVFRGGRNDGGRQRMQ